MVPGGGFEPPTRGFSVAMVLYYYLITISYIIINKVCAKVCFYCFVCSGGTTVSWTNAGNAPLQSWITFLLERQYKSKLDKVNLKTLKAGRFHSSLRHRKQLQQAQMCLNYLYQIFQRLHLVYSSRLNANLYSKLLPVRRTILSRTRGASVFR